MDLGVIMQCREEKGQRYFAAGNWRIRKYIFKARTASK
jgi:hypothetical protein